MHAHLHIRICREDDLAVLDERIPCGEQVSLHARRYADQQRGRNIYLLAWLGDAPVGHLDLRWQAMAAPMVTHVYLTGYAELKAIVVVPEHRGQGIGTRLIAAAEQIAAERGFRTVCVAVDVENTRARALYERLGYVDWGHGTVEATWTVTDQNGQETQHRGLDIYLVKELSDEDAARAPAALRSVPVSVFGLSEDQLRPIVEAAIGEPVASFDISVEHEVPRAYYGFAADKLIPTFSYVTPQGRRGRITIFAKHSGNPNSPEPEQYRFLRLHDVPLPDLYGVLRSPEGRPVLFLEYLDMSELVGGRLPPNVGLEFLSLVARFNAVHPSPEYAAWLKELHQHADDPGLAGVIDVVWERACGGGLGEELKRFCSEDVARRARLHGLADRVAARVADMETGLVSGDFSFENTGRRQNGERVIFDVEGIGLGARFTDVSDLGRPDDRWPGAPYPTREALVEHYLREYVRWGGVAPPLDQFLAETRVLWLHGEILSMNFGAGWGHVDSRAPEEQRQSSRRAMLGILKMLLDRYC